MANLIIRRTIVGYQYLVFHHYLLTTMIHETFESLSYHNYMMTVV